MIRRTTVLAGTLALACVAHVAAAQARSRPPRPRIAGIAPAPQVQAQKWEGRNATQGVESWQTGQQFNDRMGSRPSRHFPVQAAPQQTPPPRPVGIRREPSAVSRGYSPRLAGIAPAPPTPPSQFGQTVFAPTAGYGGIVQVAQFYYLPTVVLTDGRIFGNFNGRYEEVLRRCPDISGPLAPGTSFSTCWTIDSYGRYQVVQQR